MISVWILYHFQKWNIFSQENCWIDFKYLSTSIITHKITLNVFCKFWQNKKASFGFTTIEGFEQGMKLKKIDFFFCKISLKWGL